LNESVEEKDRSIGKGGGRRRRIAVEGVQLFEKKLLDTKFRGEENLTKSSNIKE
jgi:hypothetical protein